MACDYEAVLRDIQARDARDSQRSVAPLRPAEDAKIVDTTGVPVNEVMTIVGEFVKNQLLE
jgi:cytidylate kinase